MSSADKRTDRKLLLWLLGGVALMIAVIGIFTPRNAAQDPRPMTTNTGSAGTKAVFLSLQKMGRTAVTWDESSAHLAQLDAPRSTLVLAEPDVAKRDRLDLAARLRDFLQRGGRVLITGADSADLLPGGQAAAPDKLAPDLCDTVPEGPGELAAAGSAEMAYSGSWSAVGPQFRVEQRCLGTPVVVRFPVGAGEAVWWSSAMPLSNAGLKRDANLRLLLASLGEGRTVYFDEYYFGQHAGESTNPLQGLPLWAIFWQFAALCALLVWSFSRRKGPLRMPVAVPRSSPVEFAQSMGGLYSKARATGPVLEAAQRRLERLLMSEAGLSRDTVRTGPEATAEALTLRFGGEWSGLRMHLEAAGEARNSTVSPGDALALVRSLAGDEERLRAMLAPREKAADAGVVDAASQGLRTEVAVGSAR